MKTLGQLQSLEGRVAVVTGGAGHLGRAIGEVLSELGATVVLVDRELAACEARATELAAGARAPVLPLGVDLAGPGSAREIVDQTLSRLGRIDILVNNAAFTGATDLAGWAVPFDEQTAEAWNAAMAVNLTAPFLLTQAARGALEASGRGAVVNVGSIYGLTGPDFRLYEGTRMGNPAAYGASKAGLLQLTRYLATCLAPKVRVNSISPGGISRGQPETFRQRYEGRVPLGRMASEEDFKGAVAFLASDASAYVTGTDLVVDGGFTAW